MGSEGRTLFEFLFDEEGPTPDAKLKGWLRKCKRTPSSLTGKTTKRYFTLDMDELELCWFKSRSSINPSGVISLRSIKSVKDLSAKNGGEPGEHVDRFGLVIESSERSLRLLAPDRKTATYWVKGLNMHKDHLRPVESADPTADLADLDAGDVNFFEEGGEVANKPLRKKTTKANLPSDAIALMDTADAEAYRQRKAMKAHHQQQQQQAAANSEAALRRAAADKAPPRLDRDEPFEETKEPRTPLFEEENRPSPRPAPRRRDEKKNINNNNKNYNTDRRRRDDDDEEKSMDRRRRRNNNNDKNSYDDDDGRPRRRCDDNGDPDDDGSNDRRRDDDQRRRRERRRDDDEQRGRQRRSGEDEASPPPPRRASARDETAPQRRFDKSPWRYSPPPPTGNPPARGVDHRAPSSSTTTMTTPCGNHNHFPSHARGGADPPREARNNSRDAWRAPAAERGTTPPSYGRHKIPKAAKISSSDYDQGRSPCVRTNSSSSRPSSGRDRRGSGSVARSNRDDASYGGGCGRGGGEPSGVAAAASSSSSSSSRRSSREYESLTVAKPPSTTRASEGLDARRDFYDEHRDFEKKQQSSRDSFSYERRDSSDPRSDYDAGDSWAATRRAW